MMSLLIAISTLQRNRRRWHPAAVVAASLLLMAGFFVRGTAVSAESARAIPAPAVGEPTSAASSEVAVFAGGCFWGVQGVFQHVTGVANAVSGYAGGDRTTAHYEMVGDGTTGHAESVQVTIDPHKVSYARLLQVYFSVAHDPTQRDRQGPDAGTQYRSAIFPTSAEQDRVARAYIDQINQAHVFKATIVTRIEPDRTFYPAEAYHQNFLTLHPSNGYIVVNDLPKIGELKHYFPDLYRSDPASVPTTTATN
jgi:peptide-methionine (S)-S-oxide reductase